jgi:cytochrome c oxidase subunit 3
LWLAVDKFKKRDMASYRRFIVFTFLFGVLFVLLQILGFYTLTKNGLPLQKNVSVSFLYILVGVHGVHVLGGIIALFVMFIKAFSNKVRSYDSIPLEVVSTYWHFVDFLWIYLLIFLILIR